MKNKKLFLSGIALLAFFATLKYFEVDNEITAEDQVYIEKYLSEANVQPLPVDRTYEDEIKFIRSVQWAVLQRVYGNIRMYQVGRVEPKDIYTAQSSLCFGRSRVIEKILRLAGLQTRHIALYSTEKTGSKTKSLMTRGIPSHAISEVLTQKGWLVIDSNDLWLSLDSQDNPISLMEIQLQLGKQPLSWHAKHLPMMNPIYQKPFTFVYGLYSRHGKFFPPYGYFPDINYKEFTANFLR